MNDDDLIGALQRLPRQTTPPPHVREAVAREIRSRVNHTPWSSRWRVAAAAALVVAAFVAGRLSAPTVGGTSPTRQFAFLLYGGGPSTTDRVAEYAAWARGLRQDGRPVDGERLGDESWVIGAPGSSPHLGGFFIVGARDAEEAQSLARSHPHAKYGGTIVVQPVVTRSSR